MKQTPKKIGNRLRDRERTWAELLPLISSGLSLPAALAKLPAPQPSVWWCKTCLRDDPTLLARYRTAMEERADVLADEILAVANEPIPSGLSGPEASAWAQRQRLRVDAMKWTAAKLRPRVWGDHVSVDLNVSQQISITAALEQAEKRAQTFIANAAAEDIVVVEPAHESSVVRRAIER